MIPHMIHSLTSELRSIIRFIHGNKKYKNKVTDKYQATPLREVFMELEGIHVCNKVTFKKIFKKSPIMDLIFKPLCIIDATERTMAQHIVMMCKGYSFFILFMENKKLLLSVAETSVFSYLYVIRNPDIT